MARWGRTCPPPSPPAQGRVALTSRLMASLVFWKQSTNSASEGGRARSVRTPSAGCVGGREPGASPPHARGAPTPTSPRRTCRPLLALLLSLLPLVQLLESLCRLLQPGHEPLDVVQGAVEDLLESEQGESTTPVGRGWGEPPPPPADTHRLLLYSLGQNSPRLLVLGFPATVAWSGTEQLRRGPQTPKAIPVQPHGLPGSWSGTGGPTRFLA